MRSFLYACLAGMTLFDAVFASTVPEKGIRTAWAVATGNMHRLPTSLTGGTWAGRIMKAGNGALHVSDTVYSCYDVENKGTKLSTQECVESIITTAVAFGMAIANHHQTGVWGDSSPAKREDQVTNLDSWLGQFPDHIDIQDVHYFGTPMNHTHLPQSLGKRGFLQRQYHAQHNSTMPLSFVHTDTKRGNIPILVSTNGTHHHIGHLEPIDQTGSQNLRHGRRAFGTNFNPHFTHIGKGGVKVQVRSNHPVMTHTRVELFMDEDQATGKKSVPGLKMFSDILDHSPWAGFSFDNYIKDKKGNFASGQWAMYVESGKFGSKWEENWDWCFGPSQMNCQKGDHS